MSNYINNIEISNFKSIRHQKIDGCKRINVFIGYPNVGKSNILEALGLYSVMLLAQGESFVLDDICRVQHFTELYFNQAYRSDITVKLDNRFMVTVSSGQNTGIASIDFVDESDYDDKSQRLAYGDAQVTVRHSIDLNRNSGTKLQSVISNKYNNLNELPVYPIKKYQFVNNAPVHHTKGYSLSIPDGKNLLDVLQREADLRKDLAEILRTYGLKLLLDTSAESIMLIKEIDDSTVLRIPYHQIADTLKRLIFYKAAIASNNNTILLFEEPEAHMFPPYISRLTGDIIHDENKNQYFIATHSPFVINDLLEDAREDLSVYVVGYKNGETIIKRLTEEQLHEIYNHGVDLFLNIEDYLA